MIPYPQAILKFITEAWITEPAMDSHQGTAKCSSAKQSMPSSLIFSTTTNILQAVGTALYSQ